VFVWAGFFVLKADAIKPLFFGKGDPIAQRSILFRQSLWRLVEDLLQLDERRPFGVVSSIRRLAFCASLGVNVLKERDVKNVFSQHDNLSSLVPLILGLGP